MEYMSLATLIKYGTPVILLALMILQVVSMLLVTLLWKKIGRMEDHIQWKDNCNDRHIAVDQRLTRLESVTNGR